MKKNFLKILAIGIVVVGIPIGLWLSIAVGTEWWARLDLISAHRAIHWHIAIGIWLAFALIGFFVWYLDVLFMQRKIDEKSKIMLSPLFIWIVGIIASLLLGYRRREPNPWSPYGEGLGAQLVIPASFNYVFVLIPLVIFIAIGTVLLILSVQKYKEGINGKKDI